MNMNEPKLFSGQQNQLSVFTSIDALLSEYRKNRMDLERIAAYVANETGGVMRFFMSGAQVEHQISSISAASLFAVEPAVRALDASFWAQAMALTDVLETNCLLSQERSCTPTQSAILKSTKRFNSSEWKTSSCRSMIG